MVQASPLIEVFFIFFQPSEQEPSFNVNAKG